MGQEARDAGVQAKSASTMRRRFILGGDSNHKPDSESESETASKASARPPPAAQTEHSNKMKSFMVRTVSTVALISLFVLFVYLGHVFLVGLIFFIQFKMVAEMFTMARIAQKEKALPGFRAQQWYFFVVTAFYMYGRFVKQNLWSEITMDRRLMKIFGGLLRRHTLVSFSLYCIGFVLFVLSLRKQTYLYQFGQYAWTHMILLTIFVPSSFFVSNTFEGIIWLLLPCSLIIANDITAYLAGFFFGRTPLIKLSPKKTWEGFLGGMVGTIAVALLLSSFMGQYKWLVCPRKDLKIGSLDCAEDPLYQWAEFSIYDLDPWVPECIVEHVVELAHQPWFPVEVLEKIKAATFIAKPVQLHACALAVFASIIGPFGGFFASGFKRAFKIKDFGDSIPGHGGMTDRMDCQMLMAVFSYLWYHGIISVAEVTVSDIMDMVSTMAPADQLQLLAGLVDMANSEQILRGSVLNHLRELVCEGTNTTNG